MNAKWQVLGALAVALSGCQAADTRVSDAQAVFDRDLQGRACTTLTRQYYVPALEGQTAEFAKLSVLERNGVVRLRRANERGADVVYAEPLEAPGVTMLTAPGARYLCFGKWVVTDAALDRAAPAPAGQQTMNVTYKLTGAPDWITTDPEAERLSAASVRADVARMTTTNAQGQNVPASYRGSNVMPTFVPKP